MKAEKKLLILLFIAMIISTAMLMGISYLDYKLDVEECCNGYREFILEGQIGGGCMYWTFADHLKGIKGCAIQRLNETAEVQS